MPRRPASRRIGFVTYAGKPELTDDDQLAVAALGRHDIQVRPLVWNDPGVNWDDYAALIVRSTWDYHREPAAFAAWLNQMVITGRPLWNPAGLIRWNMDKGYLRELNANGVAITPTVWLAQGEPADLTAILERSGWDRAVVKPSLSATAFLTWVASPPTAADNQGQLDRMLERGGVLVQQFEEAITGGEWSLVFFSGVLSHAVLKVPQQGDFRVQKEYGGTSAPGIASPAAIALAERALGQVRFPWLYARVDLIDTGDEVRLMELEMLEPDLFLRHNEDAARGFAQAIFSKVTK